MVSNFVPTKLLNLPPVPIGDALAFARPQSQEHAVGKVAGLLFPSVPEFSAAAGNREGN